MTVTHTAPGPSSTPSAWAAAQARQETLRLLLLERFGPLDALAEEGRTRPAALPRRRLRFFDHPRYQAARRRRLLANLS